MTKYSTQFKIKVVQEYLQGGISQYKLCKKYGMADKTIAQHWINLAREHGFESLAVKHTKKRYSVKFKLQVLNYYQTHELGVGKVAAHFGLNKSLVNLWYCKYQKEGIVGLQSKVKSRIEKNMKKHMTSNKDRATKDGLYQQEIKKLKAKVAYQKMEIDILKKLHALRQQEEKNKQQ